MNATLRANPMRWAGIAMAAGFVLGIVGRILRNRRRPKLVVIKTIR